MKKINKIFAQCYNYFTAKLSLEPCLDAYETWLLYFWLHLGNGFPVPCHTCATSSVLVWRCVVWCVNLQPYVDIIFCPGDYDKYMSHRSITSRKDEIITPWRAQIENISQWYRAQAIPARVSERMNDCAFVCQTNGPLCSLRVYLTGRACWLWSPNEALFFTLAGRNTESSVTCHHTASHLVSNIEAHLQFFFLLLFDKNIQSMYQTWEQFETLMVQTQHAPHIVPIRVPPVRRLFSSRWWEAALLTSGRENQEERNTPLWVSPSSHILPGLQEATLTRVGGR